MLTPTFERNDPLSALQHAIFSDEKEENLSEQKSFLDVVSKSLFQPSIYENAGDIKKATMQPPSSLDLKKILSQNLVLFSSFKERLLACENDIEKLKICIAEIAKTFLSKETFKLENSNHSLSQYIDKMIPSEGKFPCIEEMLKRAATVKFLLDSHSENLKGNSDLSQGNPLSFQAIDMVSKKENVPFLNVQQWLELRIFLNKLSDQEFIALYLNECVDTLYTSGQISKWFYEKVEGENPHIRLRLQGQPEILYTDVSRKLSHWMQTLMELGKVRKFTTHDYEFDSEKFGGFQLYDAAQELFFQDSRYCCRILNEVQEGYIGLSIECLAALNIVAILRNLNLDLTSVIKFLGKSSIHLLKGNKEFDYTAQLSAMLLSNLGLPQHFSELEKFSAQIKMSVEKFTNHLDCLDLFIHLHCNRLLGCNPGSEKAARSIALYALEKYL